MTQINHTIIVEKQCAYKDEKGSRCKAICTLTHPYCPEHTASEQGLKVAPSTVPFAGMGLFTLKPIKKDSVIMLYNGEVLTVGQYNKRYDKEGFGEYGMTLGERKVLDARKTSDGLGRFVCDHTGSAKKPNVEYMNNRGKIEIVAIQNINAGEELLVDYGVEMRTAMGFQPVKKTNKQAEHMDIEIKLEKREKKSEKKDKKKKKEKKKDKSGKKDKKLKKEKKAKKEKAVKAEKKPAKKKAVKKTTAKKAIKKAVKKVVATKKKVTKKSTAKKVTIKKATPKKK
jgi:hypothetical protein